MTLRAAVMGALLVHGIDSMATTPPEAGKSITSGMLRVSLNTSSALGIDLLIDSTWSPIGTLRLPRVILAEGDTLPPFCIDSTSFEHGHSCCVDRFVLRGSVAIRGSMSLNLTLMLTSRFPSRNALLLTGWIGMPPEFRSARLQIGEVECLGPAGGDTVFWSFQGASYPERPDWILPLTAGFIRENFQGMNAADYGGGIPVVDVWNRSWGLAFGVLATTPEPVALPVRAATTRTVALSIEDRAFSERETEEKTYAILPAALIAHQGDCSHALEAYAAVMKDEGLPGALTPPPSAYQPEWCAWGYERSFRPENILATLPLARSLGFGWATVDDGWQTADGDWDADPGKFPDGLKPLVDSIHRAGLLARLWWVPLEAHDASYHALTYRDRMHEFGMSVQSRLALRHPDWFQRNADGRRTQVSWWNSYTLCPAVKAVREYYCELAKTMVGVWGFDGLKIDGQNLNAVPPCFNPAHHHSSPYDAPRAVPAFFRELSEAVRSVRPDAVIQLCPCGTVFSLFNLPYVTQTVASDPTSSFQVRLKAKIFHALRGATLAYSGDHVELTDRVWDAASGRTVVRGEEDFLSTIGTGGVPSSKFTRAGVLQPDTTLSLSPAKEERWRAWIAAYQRERPSLGEYLPLYDVAFDRPETHVIRKGEVMYYAFFSPDAFSGTIQLRGLAARAYEIRQFLDDTPMGVVDGQTARLTVSFSHALMIKAVPRTVH
jgi:alpha-galactosidase